MMQPIRSEAHPEFALAAANERLARLLDREPLALTTGGEQSLADRLWVWGVLGGKEVGKSSLINALAGAAIVESGNDVGEGTAHPTAYLNEGDLAMLQRRFAAMTGAPLTFRAAAPESMRGLVLVDLPDFDSLYEHHIEQVRRIAGVLDGIIWVTTPKKVGDFRAIAEIRRVLKSRSNFAYVVNKIDWLLAQSRGSPRAELERMTAALRGQVRECDSADAQSRCFLISAKYPTGEAMLDAIARSRGAAGPRAESEASAELCAAVEQVLDEFAALRRTLTTAPTAEAALAGKRANLDFQARAQASQLLSHFQPRATLDRLAALTDGEIEEIVTASFSPAYCANVVQRLNNSRPLFAEWSESVFRRRVAGWPMLGLVAWPINLLALGLRALGRLLPGGAAQAGDDPFRFDGIPLEDRAEAVVSAVGARLSGALSHLAISIPDGPTITSGFRSDAAALAEEQRAAAIAPLIEWSPRRFSRLLRGALPLAVLLWFPLIQPIVAAALGAWAGPSQPGLGLALVQALSAWNVLASLLVALLILAGVVAAIYSVAVRDVLAAIERVRNAPADLVSAALRTPVVRAIASPIDQTREQLSEATTVLERMSAGDAAKAA